MKTISQEGLMLSIEVLEIVTSLMVCYLRFHHILPSNTSSSQSIGEVIALLGTHGCKNISFSLDLDSCDTHPIAVGGLGDVYRGRLHNGSQVAIKTMRVQVNSHEDQNPLKVTLLSSCHFLDSQGVIGRGSRAPQVVEMPASKRDQAAWTCGVS